MAEMSGSRVSGTGETARNKQPVRPRHVPVRTCIACRKTAGKRTLIRLVRVGEGVEVDLSGKRDGRGTYLHAARDCWANALRSGRIEQALKVRLTPDNRAVLQQYMDSLPASGELNDEDSSSGSDGGSRPDKTAKSQSG